MLHRARFIWCAAPMAVLRRMSHVSPGGLRGASWYFAHCLESGHCKVRFAFHVRVRVVFHFSWGEDHEMADSSGDPEVFRADLAVPALIQNDNKAAIEIANQGRTSQRTRHLEIKYLFTNQMVKEKLIAVQSVASSLLHADILTKDFHP